MSAAAKHSPEQARPEEPCLSCGFMERLEAIEQAGKGRDHLLHSILESSQRMERAIMGDPAIGHIGVIEVQRAQREELAAHKEEVDKRINGVSRSTKKQFQHLFFAAGLAASGTHGLGWVVKWVSENLK